MGTVVRVPVRFYPPGGVGHMEAASRGVLEVPVAETALVLVDTWNGGDPPEGKEPSAGLRRTRLFLNACRSHGMTVIHAPNHPVVDRYPQYQAISSEVKAFLEAFPETDNRPPFLDWPPRENDVRRRAEGMRAGASTHTREERRTSGAARDISRFLTPLESEYVLATHEEFRYVLWKHKVKLLLYVGGALNECMQHRDAGINILAGSDSRRTAFTIVVLADCSSSKVTPAMGEEEISKAMLDYFMCKIAFVSEAEEVGFGSET